MDRITAQRAPRRLPWDISEIKQRLELALRPVEKPPSIEEVLEQVSTHGVLRGPVDWVFPGWRLYVDYVVKEIVGGFKLSAEEEDQLKDFGRRLNTLMEQAERQAKAELASIYRAIMEDTYRLEGRRLYAPDGTWIYIGGATARLKIHGVSAKAYFPDLLKLSREKFELLQLGWRASDEGEADSRPFMDTTQPWQVFAWTATRYGELYIRIASANLTREGVSVLVHLGAKDWKQRWSKNEAISLAVENFRRGEWAPLFTMWLGDGKVKRRGMLSGRYELVITAKEPWRLGLVANTYEALVATGKETFERLREAAGVYGELLDLLRAHKWIYVKLATEDGFRAALKQNKNSITVAGVATYLELVSGRGGSLVAKYFTRDLEKALAAARRLESAGFRPNVVRSNANYVVYIATADLLKLAERDGAIRKAIALYLADKVKNGTPRQREIVEKILKRNPLFRVQPLEIGILNWL